MYQQALTNRAGAEDGYTWSARFEVMLALGWPAKEY
jgi:hypothetical protein